MPEVVTESSSKSKQPGSSAGFINSALQPAISQSEPLAPTEQPHIVPTVPFAARSLRASPLSKKPALLGRPASAFGGIGTCVHGTRHDFASLTESLLVQIYASPKAFLEYIKPLSKLKTRSCTTA